MDAPLVLALAANDALRGRMLGRLAAYREELVTARQALRNPRGPVVDVVDERLDYVIGRLAEELVFLGRV